MQATINNNNRFISNQFTSSYYNTLPLDETIYFNREQESKVKIIRLSLNETEKRFGFSIIGGCDECLEPEIEDIVAGICI